MKVLRHISWFSEEELKGKEIIEMCQSCGNSNKKIRECPNCDILFKKYIYIEDNNE